MLIGFKVMWLHSGMILTIAKSFHFFQNGMLDELKINLAASSFFIVTLHTIMFTQNLSG
jgi:hypothetical protein